MNGQVINAAMHWINVSLIIHWAMSIDNWALRRKEHDGQEKKCAQAQANAD